MIFLLLLLLILVPLIELALLVRLAQATDLGTTLFVVILTGVLGVALARRQGMEVWQKIQAGWREGKPPTQEIVDGFLIFLAGGLLLLPGLMTDAVGLLLLIPPVRALLRGWMGRRLVPPGVRQAASWEAFQSSSRPSGSETDIEAEYTIERGEPKRPDERLPQPPNEESA